MSQWYYARNNQQNGPVSFEQLKELATNGQLSASDMVWNPPMPDWVPAGSIRELVFTANSNPYGTPDSVFTGGTVAAPAAGEPLAEIEPGSDPIDISACITRAFDLLKRNLGMMVVSTLVFLAVNFGISFLFGFTMAMLGVSSEASGQGSLTNTPEAISFNVVSNLISNVVSIFLTMGFVRIVLDAISGRPISPGQLFGQGPKLLKSVLASLLFAVAVLVGLLLLVVPGFYIAMRYGSFLYAIVDRDMSIGDAFKYSASITTNNKLRLMGLSIIAGLICLIGALACFVGLLFTFPFCYLILLVGFRWMQYGRRVTLDYPGTQEPMLKP